MHLGRGHGGRASIDGIIEGVEVTVEEPARQKRSAAAFAASSGFGAEASLDGREGLLHISSTTLKWEARRGSETLEIPLAEISEAKVAPVKSILVRVSRVTFLTVDGADIKMTVTAPSDAVEDALRSL